MALKILFIYFPNLQKSTVILSSLANSTSVYYHLVSGNYEIKFMYCVWMYDWREMKNPLPNCTFHLGWK